MELALDLQPAGLHRRPRADHRLQPGLRPLPPDRRVDRHFRLIEALAEAIAGRAARRPSPSTRSRSASASRTSAGRRRCAAPASRSAAPAGLTGRRPGARGPSGRVPRVTSIVLRLAVAQDLQLHRLARRELHEQRVERVLLVDLDPVDRQDDVAVLDAGLGRGAAGLDRRIAVPPTVVTTAPLSTVRLFSFLTCWSIDANRMPIHGRVSASPRRLVHDRLGDVDRDGEPDAARVRRDRGVDAHDAPPGRRPAGRPSCPG